MNQTPPQPLPYNLGADEIVPLTIQQIDAERKLIDGITDSIDVSTACFGNVVRPFVELENAQAGERAVIAALKYCSPSLECQHAVEKAEVMWQEYDSNLRLDLYALVKAVKARGEVVDPESRKLLDRMLLRFEKYGYGLLADDDIQRRLERLNRIEELSVKFHRNLREYNGGELFDPEDLDGIPKKDQEPLNHDRKEFFSHSSKYYTVMRNAHNPETRKRMQLGISRRYAENVSIFREVILLRDENARELGLPSHAAAKLPYRSAESTEWVEKLMDGLVETLLPHGRADFERVTEMKKRYLKENPTIRDDNSTMLMPWDYTYYSAILQKEFQVDHAAIAEYYSLRHTVGAMLDIFADCLQLQFNPIPEGELKDSVWHEEVEGWTVWDDRIGSKGVFIGYLFF